MSWPAAVRTGQGGRSPGWAVFLVPLLLALGGLSAHAACLPAPSGLLLPPATPAQVDLERELAQSWQAGGRIVVYCAADGSPRAGRLPGAPTNDAEEMARRAEHFALVKRVNLAQKSHRLPLLEQDQVDLLERFALSDAGAVWMREVVDDTLRLFNRGYLEYDRSQWDKAVQSGRVPALSDLLTGNLSERGQFAQDAQVFRIHAYSGPGAMAQPGAIGLGDSGMRCEFPTSSELVDPHAVLSHEFGHTRYGDPASAGTLLGEARTVERYENPVRVRNGYEFRVLYFQRTPEGMEPRRDSLVDRLIRLEKERGISVPDMSPVDRYHCDCPGPLPVILDCEVRKRPGTEGVLDPASERDCKVDWKPMPIFLPRIMQPID